MPYRDFVINIMILYQHAIYIKYSTNIWYQGMPWNNHIIEI